MKLFNSRKSIIKERLSVRLVFRFTVVKTLGLGTFGLVKLAIHQITQEKVAIKILEKSKIIDVADVERVSREIHILKLIRHKHVIQLYEIIETKKYIFLVMEFCDGGELFDYIVKHQKLSEIEASKFIQELISGIEYIHKLNIVHRDLKPENLLLDYQKSLKIVDFGLSNTYKQGEQLKTACGSPCYAAPEMIQGNKYNSLLVDIWSCGVILFASICGYLPFEDVNTSALYKKILNGEYKIPNFVSPEGTSFLKGILNINPEKRFNLDQIKSHPWFKLYRRSHPIPPGIIIGYHRIPIDNNIVSQLKERGFNEDYVKICLDANKQNNVTTSYFLLMKRHLMNGGMSTSDINSVHFEPKLLEPIQRTQKAPILGFLDESMLKTLNSNRSQSNQSRKNKKMNTQQNRGHYYLQDEKLNKSIQLKQSHRQDSLDSDEELSKPFSQNVTSNVKKQKVRTESNYNADQSLNQTTMIAGKRQSISPANANLILQYIKQQKKLTPTSIRNSCQQKPNILSLNYQRNVQTIYDHEGLKIMNSNKQQPNEQKRSQNNQWMPSTILNPYQLLLQLNSRKGSRDLSAPHSTKCANNPKSKSINRQF
ncbi:unnamed protein product (macronuclear) [Paramecium tetraurelia]|uniref:Protein kinase domain-containing protein n=1 Tax=Paramecium tetraurelia TaxID=5888 RepID=A0DT38_PARTE|nr:uncharacterized protein GSPATT00019898001 [Paramecium tetraurelia]CAK86205.1 unnamed protein product [Paramecium tetraurelia]|eukprot:XP_001453602.1 hypothetical protein (macronuclear) [Paramecium tetraurelia strain d4-2]